MGRGNFEGGQAAHCKVYEILSICGGDVAFCQITLTTCYTCNSKHVFKYNINSCSF